METKETHPSPLPRSLLISNLKDQDQYIAILGRSEAVGNILAEQLIIFPAVSPQHLEGQVGLLGGFIH